MSSPVSPARTAVLVCEDGRVFPGEPYGAVGTTYGEAVFATGMTGYQETLTDPSYHRQIVVMTAPHIGNTGVNEDDNESNRIWVAGYVVRDPARRASNWRSCGELTGALRDAGVVGIAGVDTRAITRHLRHVGAMRAGIFSGGAADAPDRELTSSVRASPVMMGADLASEVTTRHPYQVAAVGTRRFTVAALDLGIKRMTPTRMAQRGIDVHVLPAWSSIDDVLRVHPDGLFLSNGPGDPAVAHSVVELTRAALERGLPVFGICFGHQILARALGLDTYKLTFGHRGINQPVMDRATGRVEITAHNHGFAVAAPAGTADGAPFVTPFGEAEVSHICLNDDVVEGLRCRDVPAFSVQYHPEAAAGPHDAGYLFDRFADLMNETAVTHA
jgi:carbamoyl-phosphate synthase small subunit